MDKIKISEIYCERDRAIDKNADLRLQASIKARMDKNLFPLIQPIALQPTLRDGYKYEVADGRRRYFALKEIGIEEIQLGQDAILTDGNKEIIAFVANDERQQLGLFEQVDKIVHMKKTFKTIDSIAAELGRSNLWVARRMNLTNLSSKIKTAAKENGFPYLTIGHYEVLATFPKDIQDIIIDRLSGYSGAQYRDKSPKKFAQILHRNFATRLQDLPWKENGCGKCPACKARKEKNNLLFDLDEKDAICMDNAYINSKRKEYIKQKIEDEKLVAVSSYYHGGCDDGEEFEALHPEEYRRNYCNEPDGIKAIICDGSEAGKIIKITISNNRKINEDGSVAPNSKSLAERKEIKMTQRKRYAINLLMEYLNENKEQTPDRDTIFTLAACLGCTGAFGYSYAEEWEKTNHTIEGLQNSIVSYAKARMLPRLNEHLWAKVKRQALEELKAGQKGPVKCKWEEACILSAIIGFDIKDAAKKATEALPDPKNWIALEKAEKAEKKLLNC